MTINPIEQPSIAPSIDGTKIMPSGEGNNIADQNRVESTAAFVDPMGLSVYDFMEHTYNGSHGYRDGSYLIPGIREAFYEKRRKISYYVNVFRPLVDAMIDPVFCSSITRTAANGQEYADGFIENCDNAGTSMTRFVKSTITTARINSITFVVVDNFDVISDVESENIDQRKYPYVYEKTPQEVYSWTTNSHGGITSITFYDSLVFDKDKKTTAHFIQWDAEKQRRFHIDQFKKGEASGEQLEIEDGIIFHGLGMLPVIPVLDFARNCNMKTMPNPELFNIAKLCHALFCKESRVVMGEEYQTFSILCTSGLGRNAINLGIANFLDVSTDAKFMPQYVSPSQDGLKTVVDNCERLKEEIKNEAKQNGVTGIKESKSGLAKEWDFRAEEVVLKETAEASMNLETKIFKLVGGYLKKDLGVSVVYNTNYSPYADSDRVERMLAIIDRQPSGPINQLAQKEIVRLEWKGNEEIIEEFEEVLDQEKGISDSIGGLVDQYKEAEGEGDGEAESEPKTKEGSNE